VTWTKLLANKEAQKHKTPKKELDNMRALIARDLADAGLAGLSADRKFATAYKPCLPSLAGLPAQWLRGSNDCYARHRCV